MGYTIKEESVEKWKGLLDLIQKHEKNVLRIDTIKPAELSYELHQAIASARELGIEPYNKMKITISRKKDCILVKHKQDMVLGIEVQKQMLKIEDSVDHFGVVAQATQHSFDACGIIFLAFTGSMELVERWAEGRGLSITEREPLTLEKA